MMKRSYAQENKIKNEEERRYTLKNNIRNEKRRCKPKNNIRYEKRRYTPKNNIRNEERYKPKNNIRIKEERRYKPKNNIRIEEERRYTPKNNIINEDKRRYAPNYHRFDYPVWRYCRPRQYNVNRSSYNTNFRHTDSYFCQYYKIRQYNAYRRKHNFNFHNNDFPGRRFKTIQDKNEKQTRIPIFRGSDLPVLSYITTNQYNVNRSRVPNHGDVPNCRHNYIRSVSTVRKDTMKRRKIENDDGMLKTVCYSELHFSKSFCLINLLPDSLLLKIFSYLDFVGIFMCLRVCTRWKRIADDYSLKKVIILTNPIPEFSTYLIHLCCTRYLEALKLQNPLRLPNSLGIVIDRPNFGKIESLNMSAKSKNLKRLELFDYSLSEITVHDLPTSLKYFSVDSCKFHFNTFFSIKSYCSVAQLTCLEISGVRFSDTRSNFSQLCGFKSLKMLSLCYNYELNDEDVESMREILPQLELLNVECTAISGRGLHLIFNTCSNIRELLIGDCWQIENFDLDPLLRSKVPYLSYLCIRNTFISLNQLHVFLSCCPERSSIKVDFFQKCLNCSLQNEISERPNFYSIHLKFKHHSSLKF